MADFPGRIDQGTPHGMAEGCQCTQRTARASRARREAVALEAHSILLRAIMLLGIAACARRAAPSSHLSPAVLDSSRYPPMPNDAPPGASTRALALSMAIGRGVNFGNMLEAPTEGAWGLTVTDEFIEKAAGAPFTAVRLPVRWSNHAGVQAPYALDPVFLAHVQSIVDKLLAKGLVVILNMQHYRLLDGDPMDAGELPVDTAAVDVRFLAMWDQLATRFRGADSRLVFELYNEPHGRLNGQPWNNLAARALGAVRRTNPHRIVVIGPTHWNAAADLALLRLPNDSDLIVTIHNYAPFSFTHQGAEWVRPMLPVGMRCCTPAQEMAMIAPLDTARAWSVAKQYPVFVGEFGAYSKADEASRITFTRTMRKAIEARGMSWVYWEFAAGFGVYDPVQRAFRQDLLQALLGP